MVLYLPNFSLVFLIHVFLYAGVYCIAKKLLRAVKRSVDNRPVTRAVLVFRRKRKRFAVSKEQNMAVYGMYDPL